MSGCGGSALAVRQVVPSLNRVVPGCKKAKPVSPMAVSVLHVAYYPTLLQTRQAMLEQDGYVVTSALGNDQAIALADGRFDLVVVGFSAGYAERGRIVRWFKQHLPTIPVVALLAHSGEHFPDADCVTLSEDPRVWLSAVREAHAKRHG